MSSLNFIGGEKGGVGKSVVARVLAQYFIDKQLPFVGFDTDRSHTSFTRFYADYASPVLVDSFEGLDQLVSVFEEDTELQAMPKVIVDLAAQTAAPLARWISGMWPMPAMTRWTCWTNCWPPMVPAPTT